MKLLPLPPVPSLRRTPSSPLGVSSSGGYKAAKSGLWRLGESAILQFPNPTPSSPVHEKAGSEGLQGPEPCAPGSTAGLHPRAPARSPPAARHGRSSDSACRGGRPSPKAALGSSGSQQGHSGKVTGSPQRGDVAAGPSSWKGRGGAGRLPGPSAAPTHTSSARNV